MNFKYLAFFAVAMMTVSNSSFAQIVGQDDFDGNSLFLVRSASPDNSANGGTFPGSIFDVFGIVNRTVNFDFSDDTLIDPAFTGLLASTETSNFFGSEDLENNDNLSGTGTLLYEFNIAGASDLVFSADFAARGDFELADVLDITASIDGGQAQLLIELLVDEAAVQTYSYEDGVTTEDIADPMTINGMPLNNNYQNFSANINGTGNVLVLTFSFVGNGGSETIAIDNILIESGGKMGIPGDVNCDGIVSLLDVAPFVAAITNAVYDVKADVNGDGVDSLLDVAPFVTLVTGG